MLLLSWSVEHLNKSPNMIMIMNMISPPIQMGKASIFFVLAQTIVAERMRREQITVSASKVQYRLQHLFLILTAVYKKYECL